MNWKNTHLLQALQFVQLQSGGYLCTAKSPNDFSEIERKNCSFANNSLPLHRWRVRALTAAPRWPPHRGQPRLGQDISDKSVKLYPFDENRQIFKFLQRISRHALALLYPFAAQSTSQIYRSAWGELFILQKGVWRCLVEDKPRFPYAFLCNYWIL